MDKIVYAKRLFQIIAFGLFCFQIQNSFSKYYDEPVVQQMSYVKLDEIRMPIVYVCQENQFDYAKAKSYGYDFFSHMLLGKLNDVDKVSWVGKDGKKNFSILQHELLNFDYTNSYAMFGDAVYEETIEDSETVFVSMVGFCKIYHKTKKSIRFLSTEKSRITLVDPSYFNSLKLIGRQNVEFKQGPTSNGSYDGHWYEVEIILQDSRLKDGSHCLNFQSRERGYGQCVESIIEHSMLKWLKCLLPWFPDSTKNSCEKMENAHMTDYVHKEVKKFLNGWEMETLTPCKQPCLTMSFHVNKIDSRYNLLDESLVHIVFKEQVKVFTDVYAYGIFSLFVDLGSSLGLWLALSALSVFTFFVDFAAITKKMLSN